MHGELDCAVSEVVKRVVEDYTRAQGITVQFFADRISERYKTFEAYLNGDRRIPAAVVAKVVGRSGDARPLEVIGQACGLTCLPRRDMAEVLHTARQVDREAFEATDWVREAMESDQYVDANEFEKGNREISELKEATRRLERDWQAYYRGQGKR